MRAICIIEWFQTADEISAGNVSEDWGKMLYVEFIRAERFVFNVFWLFVPLFALLAF